MLVVNKTRLQMPDVRHTSREKSKRYILIIYSFTFTVETIITVTMGVWAISENQNLG